MKQVSLELFLLIGKYTYLLSEGDLLSGLQLRGSIHLRTNPLVSTLS
jgi:hypothetical protein